MRLSPRALAAGVLALGALALGGQALALYAKAELAQILLERSWERALADAGSSAEKPWPWADTYPVARLSAPRLGIERVILAGSSGRTLAFGPGHVSGTPTPGMAGNSAIGGHRDTHLAFLADLRLGDELWIESLGGGRHAYRVDHLDVVDHRQTEVLARTLEPRLTLITCYPFEALAPGGSQRYVVSAAAIPAEISDGIFEGIPAEERIGAWPLLTL